MTVERITQLLREAAISSPFPEEKINALRRTEALEPHARCIFSDATYLLFLDKHNKPVIWRSTARDRRILSITAELRAKLDTSWMFRLWNLHGAPWEITNWIKAQRT